jgi:hypothetical protein
VCDHATSADGTACADDANPCTADVCHAGKCAHDPTGDGAPCADDGTTCTTDVCQAGACTHPPANEGAACPDTPCSTGSKCVSGTCNHPAKPDGISCGATQYDRCLKGDCKTATGLCEVTVSGVGGTQVANWKISGQPLRTFSNGICSCGASGTHTLTVDHLTGPTTWATDATFGCTACTTEGTGSSSMVCW